ncbi:hypothetical protein [Nocardiopsis sp. LOL_012]|uniref:hypothetical protein n=1 Tax=Nocardiopsis sp. LOL_012 TaxID=3345409 RepID=UPI003A84912B
MYVFSPPTFDPGPVATVIALALIAYMLLFPLLVRRVHVQAVKRPAGPAAPTPLSRLNRLSLVAGLLSVGAAAAFAATADGLIPAHVGLAGSAFLRWPLESVLPGAALPGVGLGFSVLVQVLVGALAALVLPVVLRAQRPALAERLRSGLEHMNDPRTAAFVPRSTGEVRLAAAARAAAVLGSVAATYAVVVPLLTAGLGLPLWAVLVCVVALDAVPALALGKEAASQIAVVSALSAAGYLFVTGGMLVLPLLLWSWIAAVNLHPLSLLRRDPRTGVVGLVRRADHP